MRTKVHIVTLIIYLINSRYIIIQSDLFHATHLRSGHCRKTKCRMTEITLKNLCKHSLARRIYICIDVAIRDLTKHKTGNKPIINTYKQGFHCFMQYNN